MKIEGLLSQYQMIGGNRPLATESKTEATRIRRTDGEAGKPKPQTAPEKVEQAVRQINDYLQSVERNLQFSVDKDTRQIVVKVIDARSGEVVRQIPPESVLELARNMKMKQDQGLLFAQQA